jgi:integrase
MSQDPIRLGTISEVNELLLTRHKLEQSATSLHTRKWMGNLMVSEFGADRELSTIGRREAQDLINRLRSREMAPASIREVLSHLRKLHDLASEEAGLLPDDPYKSLRFPRVNNQRDRVMTEEEEARLKAVMKPRHFAVVQLAVHTGLRRLELWCLRPEDIQFFSRTVENGPLGKPAQELVGVAKVVTSKTGKGRVTPLNRVAAAIARYFAERGEGYLLGGKADQTRFSRCNVAGSFVTEQFKPALKEAGIEGLRWHDLRHTCASRALRNGARLEEVQQLLGHESITMTERYSHWEDSAVWSAANALASPTQNQQKPYNQAI